LIYYSKVTIRCKPTWYAGIVKPALNPPNWVFGPVWSLLYTLMAIAAYRVYEKRNTVYLSGKALNLYALQLAANALLAYTANIFY
jgi:tryptophan-rich sensory protein